MALHFRLPMSQSSKSFSQSLVLLNVSMPKITTTRVILLLLRPSEQSMMRALTLSNSTISIVGHNFGDVSHGHTQPDMLPALAARVKHKLGIQNPNCVAYDLIFGCPGWLEGVIQAQAFIKSGIAKRCLVIGAETLSRVVDHNDRDSMIFADGAGATIIEDKDEVGGLLSHRTATYTIDETYYIYSGGSYCKPTKTTPNISKWRAQSV